MKIVEKQKNKKKLIALIAVLLLLVIAGSIYGYMSYSSRELPSASPQSNPDTVPTNAPQPNLDTNPEAPAKTNTSSDPLPQPTPAKAGDKATVGVIITSNPQDSEILHINVLVQVITSAGSCTLTMTSSSGATYSQTVGVQPQSSNTTCNGFDVPLTNLPAGDWDTTVVFSNPQYTGSANKTIRVVR